MMNRFAKLGLLASTSYVIWSYGALAQQIPSFPSATVPFSGGEQTYLVQGGASKNMTMNQLATWAGPTTPNTTTLRLACTSATNCPSGDPIYASGVVRLTDGTAGAPPHYFGPDISSVCTADDVGRCVASANSGFWLAQYFAPADEREWGGVCDGHTDISTPLQNAITAINSGVALNNGNTSVVVLPTASQRCAIASNINIPGGVTLDGGNPAAFNSITLGALNTAPGIVLNPAASLLATSNGARVQNALIVASGVVFPITAEPFWTGIAINDQGHGHMQAERLEIVGFDSAIKMTGAQPYVNLVGADDSGVTNAVIELDAGNSDAGYLLNTRVTNLASGGGNNPTGPIRPGTGVRVAGTVGGLGISETLVNVLSIFMENDYDFQNGAVVHEVDADGGDGSLSPQGTTAINVGPGVTILGDLLRGSRATTAIKNAGQIYVSTLEGNFSTTCIANSGTIYTNITTMGACASSAYVALASSSILNTSHLTTTLTNSGVAPYMISNAGTIYLGNSFAGGFYFNSLTTDITGNLFSSSFQASVGSNAMLQMMQTYPTVTGAGAGSGATYGLALGPTANTIVATIHAGSAAATAGTLVLTYPVSAKGGFVCVTTLQAGGWNSPNPLKVGSSPNPASVTAFWSQSGSLVSGTSYSISYNCSFD